MTFLVNVSYENPGNRWGRKNPILDYLTVLLQVCQMLQNRTKAAFFNWKWKRSYAKERRESGERSWLAYGRSLLLVKSAFGMFAEMDSSATKLLCSSVVWIFGSIYCTSCLQQYNTGPLTYAWAKSQGTIKPGIFIGAHMSLRSCLKTCKIFEQRKEWLF